ncbi:MAG TPA: hypothetical protein VEX67_17120 [Solirubrobacteraceae bacterium]|nr:hypothetical protein [Solirubrobacteraceae bacterium]
MIAALAGLAAMPAVASGAVGNGMIAYGDDTGMKVMNANGTGSVPMFSPEPGDRPVYSPDGNAVAVRSWRQGQPRPDVAVARLDVNDGLHIVASDGALPAWSPDSKRIAYARYIPASNDTQIRVVNADGSGDTPVILELSNGCAYREFNEGLWWLPEGRLLYLCGLEIVTIKPDGTDRQTHGVPPNEAIMYDADLSPDGTTFAGPYGEGEVAVWNWTTGGTAQYTNDGQTREWMTWSPDGTKILYQGSGGTMTMPAAGGGESVLTGAFGYHYAWQPCVVGVTVTCTPTTLNGTLVTGPGDGGGDPPPTGGGGGGGGGGTPAPPAPPTPLPPAFTAFDAKPAFARGAAKQAGAKTIAVKVGCNAESAEPCAIALAARTAKPVGPKKLTVAKASVTVAPGKTRKVTLRLTAKARKLLKRKKSLKLVIAARARRSDGASVVTTTTVKLKAPKKKRAR